LVADSSQKGHETNNNPENLVTPSLEQLTTDLGKIYVNYLEKRKELDDLEAKWNEAITYLQRMIIGGYHDKEPIVPGVFRPPPPRK